MKNFILAFLLLQSGLSTRGAEQPADWEKNFLHPPLSARPWVYWFWLNGNITSNGITADLEAMKKVGIGGVLIMEVDQGAPKGPADFGGPAWRGLFKHVCAEANRLGLEVNMNNDAGWCGSGGPWITPELAMQRVVWTETNVFGPSKVELALPKPTVVSNYYRDISILAFPTPNGNARLPDLEAKAAVVPKMVPIIASFPAVPADETVVRSQVLELTAKLDASGNFRWDVPAGKWTILRLGHTPTGADNHPAPEPGRGLESDKLSKEATDAMFNGLMRNLITDSPALAGKTLVATHIDSWETGSQNWTLRFPDEFRSRRGYDLFAFLPVLTGRIVESREISERFLWDVRQTISELLVQNYAGEFRRLARQQGLRLSIEAYDGTPCDDLTYAGQADEPMAEFWSWGYNTAYSCVEMSSAAHVFGKRILGAEAFTANDQEKWLHHPASIKTLGDWAFCEGINRFVFHRYALQPWTNRRPGMSMGPWGLHYERTQTWWEQSAAWHEYLARCQYLLRQGTFVADICFLQPEGSPMRFIPTMPWRTGNTPERPRYNFDGCPPEVVLHRMKVTDGKLVLPDGPTYQVMVLPQVESMTPPLLRKIGELVRQGATIIGPPPQKSPSLENYPGSDSEVQKLAKALWEGAGHGNPAGPRGTGPRRVVWDQKFKTPQGSEDLRSVLQKAKWIWHREGNPAISAPPGKRYFRRTLVLPAEASIEFARFSLTVDNAFELWVNGKSAGIGDNFHHVYDYDVKALLQAGTNVLAIAAENTTASPSPAGVIGALRITFRDGSTLEVNTDAQWQSSPNAEDPWKTPVTSTTEWPPVLELGSLGMAPWGELETFSGPPYVYPDFQAIVEMLRSSGLQPDFETDPRLRFIHRREGSADIYFVANSTTNSLQATCAFRVLGKRPEFWDPLTGHIGVAASFHEEGGRTLVPISFEPAGSLFVVFRESHRDAKDKPAAIVALTREGQNLFPDIGKAIDEPAPIELIAMKNRPVRLRAWQSGRYEITGASGWKCSTELLAAPRTFKVDGPWEVEFQQAARPSLVVTFRELHDWAQDPNPTIKYFSGTACYRKSLVMPAELCDKSQPLQLDLGEVGVMAQVNVNDRDLGTLWKPPYHLYLTNVLKPGENRLQVKVVNLWVNRMIGDEQLPEDSERNSDGTLRKWPDWLLQGLPSPTGRLSFTSWRLWKKDSPLQPSGLLGPVGIRVAQEVMIPAR